MTERKNETSPEIESLPRREEDLQQEQAEKAEGGWWHEVLVSQARGGETGVPTDQFSASFSKIEY